MFLLKWLRADEQNVGKKEKIYTSNIMLKLCLHKYINYLSFIAIKQNPISIHIYKVGQSSNNKHFDAFVLDNEIFENLFWVECQEA